MAELATFRELREFYNRARLLINLAYSQQISKPIGEGLRELGMAMKEEFGCSEMRLARMVLFEMSDDSRIGAEPTRILREMQKRFKG